MVESKKLLAEAKKVVSRRHKVIHDAWTVSRKVKLLDMKLQKSSKTI